eukprot:739685-Prymnesium_polylepis.1
MCPSSPRAQVPLPHRGPRRPRARAPGGGRRGGGAVGQAVRVDDRALTRLLEDSPRARRAAVQVRSAPGVRARWSCWDAGCGRTKVLRVKLP